MKRLLALPLLLLLTSCGGNSAAIAVASLGIAGAGLATYCATAPCSRDVTTYATSVINEATRDVAILESGAATQEQLRLVASNISDLLISGHLLPNAPPPVLGIITAANAVLPLVQALVKPDAPATVLPPLTARDHAAMARMRAKIATARKIK